MLSLGRIPSGLTSCYSSRVIEMKRRDRVDEKIETTRFFDRGKSAKVTSGDEIRVLDLPSLTILPAIVATIGNEKLRMRTKIHIQRRKSLAVAEDDSSST